MTFEEWAAYSIGFIQGFAFFIFFAIVIYVGGRVHGWQRRERPPRKDKTKKQDPGPKEL